VVFAEKRRKYTIGEIKPKSIPKRDKVKTRTAKNFGQHWVLD
jgi:hypothetical protein